jgi:hypothetical protein
MAYVIRVELHPLGVVVQNEAGQRELLIEGEACCGVPLDELKHIAATTGRIEFDDTKANCCRLG